MTEAPSPGAALDAIIARNRWLLLDFDGPICSIFSGLPAPTCPARPGSEQGAGSTREKPDRREPPAVDGPRMQKDPAAVDGSLAPCFSAEAHGAGRWRRAVSPHTPPRSTHRHAPW
jgi:hypothetical protein